MSQRFLNFIGQSAIVFAILSSMFILIAPAALHSKHSQPPIGQFAEFVRILERPGVQAYAITCISCVMVFLGGALLVGFIRQRQQLRQNKQQPTDGQSAN